MPCSRESPSASPWHPALGLAPTLTWGSVWTVKQLPAPSLRTLSPLRRPWPLTQAAPLGLPMCLPLPRSPTLSAECPMVTTAPWDSARVGGRDTVTTTLTKTTGASCTAQWHISVDEFYHPGCSRGAMARAAGPRPGLEASLLLFVLGTGGGVWPTPRCCSRSCICRPSLGSSCVLRSMGESWCVTEPFCEVRILQGQPLSRHAARMTG